MNKGFIRRQALSLLLIVSILVGVILPSTCSNASSNIQQKIFKENGIEYTLSISVNGNSNPVYTVTSSENKNKVVFTGDSEKITVTEYNYKGTSILGTKKYDKSTKKFNIAEEAKEKEVSAEGIKYGKKKYARVTDEYWYSKGSNGKKTYEKIGCYYTYQIRTDNLSSSKKKNVTAYENAIKKSNNYYDKAVADMGVGSVALVVGLVAAYIFTFPVAVVVTIIVGLTGIASRMIYNVIDAYSQLDTVDDYYEEIKTYGKRV